MNIHVDITNTSNKKTYQTVMICGKNMTMVIDLWGNIYFVPGYAMSRCPRVKSIQFDGIRSIRH